MNSGRYMLDGKKAVACDDLIKWANWFATANRHVAKEEIGDATISTVFLGLNHSFGEPRPLLFETMVFGGDLDEYQERCSTWEEAETMHAETVRRVKAKQEASNDRRTL